MAYEDDGYLETRGISKDKLEDKPWTYIQMAHIEDCICGGCYGEIRRFSLANPLQCSICHKSIENNSEVVGDVDNDTARSYSHYSCVADRF